MIGLQAIRNQCATPADAVRWACLLEATAPKAGNVYPGRPFNDLNYLHFVSAAEISASCFQQTALPFSDRVLAATRRVVQHCGSNVNLGILLLLGPLVECDERYSDINPGRAPGRADWCETISVVLQHMKSQDAANLYEAINTAHPGGMGQADEMDLSGPPPADFLSAMQSAAERDRIARNYAGDFRDLVHEIVPVLESSIHDAGDLLSGIANAHIRLLASEPDSLIIRKFGEELAKDVQRMAKAAVENPARQTDLEKYLRTGRHGDTDPASAAEPAKINPGTTADLIAAGLYILLREQQNN